MKFILLSLFVILMTNCIYDDNDDCGKPFVHFSYRGDGTKQIFDEKIEKVDLYIFDADKHLLQSRIINKVDLLQNHGESLDFLSPGDYHIVCVGNAFSETAIQINSAGDLDSLHIGNPNVFAHKEVTSNDSLYIGYKKITIRDHTHYKMPNDTINFASAHIKMFIEVAGLIPPTEQKTTKLSLNSLKLVINNLPTSINFMNLADRQLYSYTQKFLYNTTDKMYYTEFDVLRFQEKSTITIDLVNELNVIVFSMKLEDFLAKYTQFDLTKNEVTLGIHINFLGENISVKAPDWLINEDIESEF